MAKKNYVKIRRAAVGQPDKMVWSYVISSFSAVWLFSY